MWIIGFFAIASGAFLLMGLLTSIASGLIALGSLGFALSWFPVASTNLFYSSLAIFFIAIMAVAIFLLGPGAFSLDAHLFGRREIIIPRTPGSSEF